MKISKLMGCLVIAVALSPTQLLAVSFPDKGGVGSCSFSNPYAGTNDCIQYNGDDWTNETAAADCGSLFTAPYTSTYNPGGICVTPDHVANCVEDQGGALEKINENAAADADQCPTLSAVCVSIIGGNYYPVEGGICEEPPISGGCEGLEPEACAAMDTNADVVVAIEGAFISFLPANGAAVSGVIILPGANVVPQAYAPLAQELAKSGLYAAVLSAPDTTFFNDVMVDSPGISNWFLGGHSLGGTTAAKYITNNPGSFDGLALMASYPDVVDDLSARSLSVVSIYGNLDLIATEAEVLAGASLLPANKTVFAEVRGGNHAQFGFYGEQSGDGSAEVSGEEQTALTAASIVHMVNRSLAGADVSDTIFKPLLDDWSQAVCFISQLNVANFGTNVLPIGDVDVSVNTYRSEFVPAQTGIDASSATPLSIASYIVQTGNATVLDLPPIIDGEGQCKMQTQESIVSKLNLKPRGDQRQCGSALTQVLYTSFFLLPDTDKYKVAQWSFQIQDDVLYPTGPDFVLEDIGMGVDIDESTKTVTLTSAAFFASLDPVNGAAAGRNYCKTMTYIGAYQLLRQLVEASD
jgi:Alpha/beta hydrolase family